MNFLDEGNLCLNEGFKNGLFGISLYEILVWNLKQQTLFLCVIDLHQIAVESEVVFEGAVNLPINVDHILCEYFSCPLVTWHQLSQVDADQRPSCVILVHFISILVDEQISGLAGHYLVTELSCDLHLIHEQQSSQAIGNDIYDFLLVVFSLLIFVIIFLRQ